MMQSFRLEGISGDHRSQLSAHSKGQLHHNSQGLAQLSLEYFEKLQFHFGQPVPIFDNPHCEKNLSHIEMRILAFQFVPLVSPYKHCAPRKDSGSVFSLPSYCTAEDSK